MKSLDFCIRGQRGEGAPFLQAVIKDGVVCLQDHHQIEPPAKQILSQQSKFLVDKVREGKSPSYPPVTHAK